MLDITDFREGLLAIQQNCSDVGRKSLLQNVYGGHSHAGKGGNLERLRELQRRRFADPKQVDKVVELDEAWRNGEHNQPHVHAAKRPLCSLKM